MGEFRLRKSGGGSTVRGADRLRGTTGAAVAPLQLLQTPTVRNPSVVIPPTPPIVMNRIVQAPSLPNPATRFVIAVPLSTTCVTVYPPAVSGSTTQQQIPVPRLLPGNGSGAVVLPAGLAHAVTVPRLVISSVLRSHDLRTSIPVQLLSAGAQFHAPAVQRGITVPLLVKSPTVGSPQVTQQGFAVPPIIVPTLLRPAVLGSPAVAHLGEKGFIAIDDEALMSVEIGDS